MNTITKSVIYGTTAALLVLPLAACDNEKKEEAKPTPTVTETVTPGTKSTHDPVVPGEHCRDMGSSATVPPKDSAGGSGS